MPKSLAKYSRMESYFPSAFESYHSYLHTHTHTHTQWEHYSDIKRNEILPFATAWMDLKGIILVK